MSTTRSGGPGDTPVLPGPLGPMLEPEPKVDYSAVLRVGPSPAVKGLVGVLVALLVGFSLIVPLVNQLVLGMGWLLSGRPGTFTAYATKAVNYEFPAGLVAGHIALATLIPITLALVIFWHRVPGRFMVSVQPGMRWRYLLGCFLLAVVGLNAVMWLSRIGTEQHWGVPREAALWLVAIVLFSPLQAAGEEFLFRGYLMQALGATTRFRAFPVVASALVFALLHGTQNLWLFIDRFAFGLLAGVLVVITGGLEAGIGAHVSNNLFAFGYAVFSGGVAQARALQQIGPWQALWDVVGFALVGALAWWLARRMRVATRTPAREPIAPLRTRRRSKRRRG